MSREHVLELHSLHQVLTPRGKLTSDCSKSLGRTERRKKEGGEIEILVTLYLPSKPHHGHNHLRVSLHLKQHWSLDQARGLQNAPPVFSLHHLVEIQVCTSIECLQLTSRLCFTLLPLAAGLQMLTIRPSDWVPWRWAQFSS